MPSSETTRRQYRRRPARYTSDLTEAECRLVAPFLPPPKPVGRPRMTDLREVVNAILCIATTGCQWAQLPKDFPPPSTVQRNFYDWRARAEAWVNIAHIRLTTRRLARHCFSA